MIKNVKKRRGKMFTKAHQPSNDAKKVKKHKTLVKEKIGLESWESLAAYIDTSGVSQFMKELSMLKGKDYIIAFLAILEYFKPKLQRTEISGEINIPTYDLTKLTDDELKSFLLIQQKMIS